jgi:hypothetical protein
MGKKLDYFSFAMRDDDGHHWDIVAEGQRIATIRGEPGEYALCVGRNATTRITTYHKTVLGAMMHLVEGFIHD